MIDKSLFYILFFLLICPASVFSENNKQKTFCNPLDLEYRFQFEDSYREAADPVIVVYQDKYWLFASKSGGYWVSDELNNWEFIQTPDLPVEEYAPTVIVMRDSLFFLAQKNVFVTNTPETGKWTHRASINHGVTDPALFLDDDNRLYLFHGCKEFQPLIGVELDINTFRFIGEEKEVLHADYEKRGWEVAGHTNQGKEEGNTNLNNFLPWIEGAWLDKFDGKYYLQYAAPGTQFKSYADGVFVSDSILSGYQYADYSPFSYKPNGFMAGAGHSCTFKDKQNDLWHITSSTISVRHMFERRLSLFPTDVLIDGQLVSNTYLGDYPQYVRKKRGKTLNTLTGWMLLSYNKSVSVSSTYSDGLQYRAENAVDEDITTWWSATSGDKNEWIELDLEKTSSIRAIQLNMADQNSQAQGRLYNDGYAYRIEISSNKTNWRCIYDNEGEIHDKPHFYIEFSKTHKARYIRVINHHSPADSFFSISGLRVFGTAKGKKPEKTQITTIERNETDKRSVFIKWKPSKNADFYIIRYGITPDKLYHSYPVYNSTNISIHALNADTDYYFTIDAINACGIKKGRIITPVH